MFASQLPPPKLSLKMPLQIASPPQERAFFSFQMTPAVRAIARQLSGKNCLAVIFASRHQDASPGPLDYNMAQDINSPRGPSRQKLWYRNRIQIPCPEGPVRHRGVKNCRGTIFAPVLPLNYPHHEGILGTIWGTIFCPPIAYFQGLNHSQEQFEGQFKGQFQRG